MVYVVGIGAQEVVAVEVLVCEAWRDMYVCLAMSVCAYGCAILCVLEVRAPVPLPRRVLATPGSIHAFIPSGWRHRGGIHWRANDGLGIAERRKAVGSVRLPLALLRRLNDKVSKLAQSGRTMAHDVLEAVTVARRLARPAALPVRSVVPSAHLGMAIKIGVARAFSSC